VSRPAIDFVPAFVRPIRVPERVPLGRAEPEAALAGEKGTWTLPLRLTDAVEAGAMLKLQVFGGRNNKGSFKAPQVDRPADDGYVSIHTPDGTPIAAKAGAKVGTFVFTVPDGGLAADDVVTVVLGDTSGGGGGIVAPTVSQLNKFIVLYRPQSAEDLPNAWTVANDQQILAACSMHILGGAIDHLRAYAPSDAVVGEPFDVLVRTDDAYSNPSCQRLGELTAFLGDEALDATVEPVPETTCVRLRLSLPREGVHRIRIRDARTGKDATANPTVCAATLLEQPVLWGMIHGHTEMSDGTGTLDHYFAQIRDEAALDFAATSDHDHLYETSDAFWQATCDAVKQWHEPGRFVTFLGYEWAKWRRKGEADRNVYYLHDHRPMYRSDIGHHPWPPDLFAALRNEQAMVIPHHTGHGGSFCDWKDHDPECERLVEIYQMRGSYERLDDNPLPESDDMQAKVATVPEGYVDRALAMGWRVGFTAGGDDHLSHAGTDFPFGPQHYGAGLMCVLAADRTREAVWDALWHRRVVATSGPRILLDYTLNGQPLGSELSAAAMPELSARRTLRIVCHATAPIERLDIIRSNQIVHTVAGDSPDLEVTWDDESPLADALLPAARHCGHAFAFYYVRMLQADGQMAWASPVWIDPA